MTDKRFTLKEYLTNHYAILDNGEEIAYVDHKSAFTICELLNELYEENEQLKYNLSAHMVDLNNYTGKCSALEIENEQLKESVYSWSKSYNRVYKENEQLKEELKEFKDFVYSDEKILCYTCVNCLSKGIYQIECSEKGKVDVHGSCFAYWKNEVEE